MNQLESGERLSDPSYQAVYMQRSKRSHFNIGKERQRQTGGQTGRHRSQVQAPITIHSLENSLQEFRIPLI
jgi:hypothetical protein